MCWPSLTTRVPFTHTSRMPVESWCASSKVAWSVDGFSVEKHYIGVAAGKEQPAIAQAEPSGNSSTHLADRVLQCQQLVLAHVLRQHAG